jgi:hypothetical protein
MQEDGERKRQKVFILAEWRGDSEAKSGSEASLELCSVSSPPQAGCLEPAGHRPGSSNATAQPHH